MVSKVMVSRNSVKNKRIAKLWKSKFYQEIIFVKNWELNHSKL
jgi:hypothetical protein